MFYKRSLTIFIALLASWPAWAENHSGKESKLLEEVVVSAFRQVSAHELDASVSVLDSETVESAALSHFQELIELIPNMNLSGEGSRARYFQLRGIGELEQYEGAPNPSVGFIIDDIDLSGVGGVSSMFDINAVEVLRGPQATRFGANAIAGLVYLQSAEASQDTEFNMQFMLGSDDTRSAAVALGGDLTEHLDVRISVQEFGTNGFYENESLGVDDSNERDERVSRVKLAWDLGDGWSARLSGLHADFDNGYDAWSPENGRTTYSDNPGRDEQKTNGGSLKISGPVSSGVDLVSITAYASSDILFSYDGEWGDEQYWQPYVYDYSYADKRERETRSQEFRILSSPQGRIFSDRADWLLGLYIQSLDESNRILSEGIYDDSSDAPFSYCTPCLDRSRLNSNYEANNYSVFGQLDVALSERLSLLAGARIERWKADYGDLFIDEIYGDPDSPITHEFHPDENLWGLNLSLGYEISGTSRLYALVSRGYKAGGFNPSLARALGPQADNGPASIDFDPELLLNFETGIKGQWLDDRLSGEISVFYMDRQDMQLRSSAQFTDNPNDFIYITSNADGHSWGLEASAQWQLSANWSLRGNLGMLETEVDDYRLLREADIEGELEGRAFAHAPPYTFNLGLMYEGPTDRGGSWVARLDWNAVGAFYFDYSHDEKASAHQTVNVRLGKVWPNWEVYAWTRNLLDEEYHSRGFSFGLAPPWFERSRFTRLGDPRQYGLTVNYRY